MCVAHSGNKVKTALTRSTWLICIIQLDQECHTDTVCVYVLPLHKIKTGVY